MSWKFQKYGTKADPVRQSDLGELAGAYGCAERFRRRKTAEAEGKEAFETFSSRRSVGTAVHEAIAKYLKNVAARDRLFAGDLPSPEAVRLVLAEWLDESVIDDGEMDASVAMVRGALAGLVVHATEVILCEAPFLAEIVADDRSYWIKGTVDVVYRPRADPDGLGLADWKTGAERMPQVILDHGYQGGFYSAALANGVFFPEAPEAEQKRLARFPTEIFIVHLRDHEPYKRGGTKAVSRPEEAAFYGAAVGDKVKYVAGNERGPAWYRSNRTPDQVARLAHSLRTLVGIVRRGGFVESIGEHCNRCAYRSACFSQGYGVQGEERAELERALKGLTGTDDGLAA